MKSVIAHCRVARQDFTLDVALELPGRGVTAVFGVSGSGKSTLLRCIAGLERQCQGLVEVNGRRWQEGRRGMPAHQRAVGYVFQQANLFPHLSVQRNLEFGMRRSPSSVSLSAVVELLGIGHLMARMPAGLSGGEQQRVGIARALLVNPQILLLDEPLAALDYQRKAEILPYLERLHQALQIPMLYVTHAVDEVARLADQVVILESGRVRAQGPVAATMARLDLPLAQAQDGAVVIDGHIAAYDAEYHLLKVAFSGGELYVGSQARPVGQAVRLQVLARDVSLSLTEPQESSILNRLPARVIEGEALADTPAHILMRLDVGGTALLSRITRRSRDMLGLVAGTPVWIQVKAVALLA